MYSLSASSHRGITLTAFQGTGDNFYKQGQLLPENFLKAAREAGHDEFQVRVRSQPDYDHSYYFVSDSIVSSETKILTSLQRYQPLRQITSIVSLSLLAYDSKPTQTPTVHANFLKA